MSETRPVYQVSDLLNEMRRLMEMSYPEIWIEGELSSLSKPASGHLYFTLKDQKSQLRCAMFRSQASRNAYKPKEGDLVRVRAKISVYTARGDLQCIAQSIEEAGEGVLQRRFEELKTKLSAQGLFDQQHKQALPAFAQHIGLITSPTGAAVQDILSTLKRRCPSISVTIYPAVVQGDTASQTLIQAINNAVAHQQCDVLVLSRGGGSMEDLWCFNDEQLARAIHQCPIPIVSAVGHEVDMTIADFVADLRAPTPTAAAELLSPESSQLQQQLVNHGQRLQHALNRQLQRLAQNVDMTFQQLTHPKLQLERKQQTLVQFQQRLTLSMQSQLQSCRVKTQHKQQQLKSLRPDKSINLAQNKLQELSRRLQQSQQYHLNTHSQQLNSLSEQLNLVSPLATLGRGFSITSDQDNNIIRSTEQVVEQQTINVRLGNGKLSCLVNDVSQ